MFRKNSLKNNYNLIHFIVGDEHLQPLVQSQVFEQAQTQKTAQGVFKPRKVKVLYYCHYRDYLNGSNYRFLREYKVKFPSIRLVPIYRTIRFSKYLKGIQLVLKLFSRDQVIVHCRGESAHKEIRTLPFVRYLNIKTVLDIRGIWAYERLLHNGVSSLLNATVEQRTLFFRDMASTIKEVYSADGLSFVSENLHRLIHEHSKYSTPKRIVVPCVTSVANFDAVVPAEFGCSQECFTIVYVGTDKPYQHLGDLVFPFVKKLMLADERVRLKILSKDKASILLKIKKIGLDLEKINIKSVDRSDIFNEIESAHLAILLREANVVNKVSSPVKLGEYIGCGLPVLYQKDSLGFCNDIFNNHLGVEVDLRKSDNWDREVTKVIKFLENEKLASSSQRIKKFFKEYYCWESYVHVQRVFYREVLDN